MDELEFRRQSMLMDANYNQQVDLLNRAKASALSQINANNSWSAEQAQKQMDFQERMSNTSHQREMEDLKAAGLNPVLSAQSGATSPSGAMAQADPNATSAMVSLMNKMLDIQNDNAKSQMALSMAAAGDISGISDYVSRRKGTYTSSGFSSAKEANREMGFFEKNLAILALMSQGYSYSQAKNMVELGYNIADGVEKMTGSSSNDNSGKGLLASLVEGAKNTWNNLSDKFNNTALGKATNKVVNQIRAAQKSATTHVKNEIAQKGLGKAILDGLKGLTKNYR